MDPTVPIPAHLQHLLPLSDEMSFLLGVLSLMGTGPKDFVYPEYFEVLSQQNPDMKPCSDGTKLEDAYPGLVENFLLPRFDNEKRKFYYLRLDRNGFLRCLSPMLEAKVFTAAAKLLRKFFPGQNGEASMFLQWNTCEKHAGHVRSLCTKWGIYHKKQDKMIDMPLDFVYLLRYCAGYFNEMNMNANVLVLVHTAMKIMNTHDFFQQESFSQLESLSQLELLQAHLLSLDCSLSVQNARYYSAEFSAGMCYHLRLGRSSSSGTYEGYPIDSLELHLASMHAALKNYHTSLTMCSSILEGTCARGAGYPEARDLAMHAATLGARVEMLRREYDQANQMISYASSIFDPATDSPVFKRAIEYLRGDMSRARGEFVQAKEHYLNCMLPEYDTVMNVGQPDYERTISIHYKLALMNMQGSKGSRRAVSRLRFDLEMTAKKEFGRSILWHLR